MASEDLESNAYGHCMLFCLEKSSMTMPQTWVWNHMRVSKWWQDCHFGFNCSFKIVNRDMLDILSSAKTQYNLQVSFLYDWIRFVSLVFNYYLGLCSGLVPSVKILTFLCKTCKWLEFWKSCRVSLKNRENLCACVCARKGNRTSAKSHKRQGLL